MSRSGRELPVHAVHRFAAVVAAELVAIRLVVEPLLVELRRVLDLVLRAVDEDRLSIRVDVTNQAGRDHQLLAEDPGTRVDDDEATADLPGRLVDLADLAVGRLDLEAGEIDIRRCLDGEGPHLEDRHYCTPLRLARLVGFTVRTHFAYPRASAPNKKKVGVLQVSCLSERAVDVRATRLALCSS